MDARLARMKMANDRTSARRRHSRARDDPSRTRESRRARGHTFSVDGERDEEEDEEDVGGARTAWEREPFPVVDLIHLIDSIHSWR